MKPISWVNPDRSINYLEGPFWTIHAPLWFHERGLSETASGYGKRLRSPHCAVLPDGRVRRIYVSIYSNLGTAWIVLDGRQTVVRDGC